jgi:outer membrane protein OmpA-like peptidoglycan-associated protein
VKDGTTEQPVWPAVEKAHPLVESTVFPQIDALRKISVGTPKLEVYRLLGHPMYLEGLGGVHEWDYVFKFPTSEQGQYVTCQYKVLFDDKMQSKQTFWNPAACAELTGPAQAAQPAEPAHVAAATELSADFLFDFDSDRLSADAPASIDAKVMEVLNRAERVEVLRVIGYTDRLGSDAYNQQLSLRRAEAVKQYLVSRGVPGEAVQTVGRGPAEPVVQCPGAKTPATVACLKPNRRVRIEVIAR